MHKSPSYTSNYWLVRKYLVAAGLIKGCSDKFRLTDVAEVRVSKEIGLFNIYKN